MRELDVVRTLVDERPGYERHRHAQAFVVWDPRFLMLREDAENDVQLLELLELQQTSLAEQLGRVVSPHVPPRIAGDAQAPRLKHPTWLVHAAVHPRPDMINEDAITARVEVVDGEEGIVGRLRYQQRLVAGQHLVPGLCAGVEEAEEAAWAG